MLTIVFRIGKKFLINNNNQSIRSQQRVKEVQEILLHSLSKMTRLSLCSKLYVQLSTSNTASLLSFQDHLTGTVLSEPHLHTHFLIPLTNCENKVHKRLPVASYSLLLALIRQRETPAATPQFIVCLSTPLSYFVKLCKCCFNHTQQWNATEWTHSQVFSTA